MKILSADGKLLPLPPGVTITIRKEEWEKIGRDSGWSLTAKKKGCRCPVCEDWGVVPTKPGARYKYKDCPAQCRAWRKMKDEEADGL